MTNNNDITLFAQTNFRDQLVKFGIKRDDRRRHMYLIGKTGMGKSNTVENMVIGDVLAGNGVCLIDPHGDTAEKVLNHIPNRRVNDVVYFNPADLDYPIAFNVLESVDPTKKHLIASGLIGVFKKIWADSWGPRLEYVLRNAILALLDYQGSTLLGITRMMVDKEYRKRVIEKIQDPIVKAFWVNEYSKYPDRFQVEAIAPIQNKVGQFLSNSLIRNIVGQVKSTIDMRETMDQKKIFIANLSKGRIGEDTSALLGAMFITKLYLAAMSRIDVAEEKREDFYLYVDEFQNFATESFANILSEARKYRLNLIIAHQYIEQLDEKVAAAVFGNVGTIICFRVGAADAEELEKEFMPTFTKEDLVNLTKFNIYLRLMIDGVASDPFSAITLPPIGNPTNNHDKIVALSRERYAKSRQIIEEKIAHWTQVDELERRTKQSEQDKAKIPQPKQQPAPSKKQFVKTDKIIEANCSRCNKKVRLNFPPGHNKAVYCRNCLAIVREEQNKKHLEAKPFLKPEIAEEEVAQPQKEISLAEAFNKNPVDFKGKPLVAIQKHENPRTITKYGAGTKTRKQDENKEINADKEENLKQQEENSPHHLEAGEIVRF
jgi:CxxC-x17-CxxC domain-containing protein